MLSRKGERQGAMGADLRGGVWALRPGGPPYSPEHNLYTAAACNLGVPALALLPGALLTSA